MTEITTNLSNKSTEIKSNKKRDIKIVSLIKINPKFSKKNKNNKSFLGLKRKSFKKTTKKINQKNKNKNKLSINKQEQFIINKNNIINNFNNIEPCSICYEKINFKDRHFLHCGHCFHCICINKWIELGKYECPLCKQDIDCDKALDNSISLEEEDNEGNFEFNLDNFYYNNFNHRQNQINDNIWNQKDVMFILIIYILIVFFCYMSNMQNNNEIILF